VPADKIASDEMQTFYDEMIESMILANGIGIAATQVGRPIRAFVVSKEYTENGDHLVLINPRLAGTSKKMFELDQGCLSVPGVTGPVERPAKVRIKGFLRDGSKADIKAKGMLAQILQHELDHLDATLFIDKSPHLTTHDPAESQ